MVEQEQDFLRETGKKLWTAADRLRTSLDAAVYRHSVFGFGFLMYVSDTFDTLHQEVLAQLPVKKFDFFRDLAGCIKPGAYEAALTADLEERDYNNTQHVFWVLATAQRRNIQAWVKMLACHGIVLSVPLSLIQPVDDRAGRVGI